MLSIAKNNMANIITVRDIADFLTNSAWVFCFTYLTVLKISSGALIFGWDMLFGIPFIADQSKIEL